MKTRFSTLDIRGIVAELQERYQGMRVMNVYDIDSKTYLIKLAKPEHKTILLLEAGIRVHSTDFQWPKNVSPSSFSMKLRKHLRTRRLETVTQLGVDRIVDFQFGSSDAAYHVILELYDRGNIVLTDHEYTILNILRPRTDHSEDVRFAVHEKYPVDGAKSNDGPPTQDELMSILLSAKEGDNLKKILNPKLVYGPALIEHCLQTAGIPANACLAKDFTVSDDMPKLMAALIQAESMMEAATTSRKGFIIQKKEKKAAIKGEEAKEELLTYNEYHPFLFKQHEEFEHIELDSYNKTVDEFYSKIGSQKLDMKTLQQERNALKKLEHIKSDHDRRLVGLQREQETDRMKATLIETNLDLVDRAILVVRSAIANQIDWAEIHTIVKEAQARHDPVAGAIRTLKLDTNHITMFLKDPYLDSDEEADAEDHEAIVPMKVDIDLELTAYANARKYYDKKRKAANKEQKTVDASSKALKSAEKKTYQTLKEVQTVATISKARKTYWFEKFLWFISSENYVIIGGRDQQQNEHIVKKYLNQGDLYVHADLHGASSVIIKNPTGEPVPPKTLNEAGTMALCNSAAWDAKVVTSAWWVYHHQVTKTAPSGEYLTTGSFMIRGKKNFLPPSYLIYGFGFLFKVDEDSVFRHVGERRVKSLDDDTLSIASSSVADDVELTSKDGDGDGNDDDSDEDDNDESSTSNQSESIETSDSKVSTVSEAGDGDQMAGEGEEDEEEEKQEEEEEEEESLFPDTNIDLQYDKSGKLRVQVGRTLSGNHDDAGTDSDASSTTSGVSRGRRMSAKQRREMKKKAKKRGGPVEGTLLEEKRVEGTVSEEASGDSAASRDASREAKPQQPSKKPQPKQQQQQQQQQPVQAKRGQKAKLKKMKAKYADQDEAERKLRMEILASAGPQKEPKRKGKKGKQAQQAPRPSGPPGQAPKPGQKPPPKGHPGRPLTIDDIKVEPATAPVAGDTVSDPTPAAAPRTAKEGAEGADALSDEEKLALMDEEHLQYGQDANELDSLTGLPVTDDILHFCIPVCGPYSALLNYKYKVKLTPGGTKRGKAAKTAVHAFTHDRSTTNREKDLFKSLKDVDLSRNIPGKVKVSAPNLQKQKKR